MTIDKRSVGLTVDGVEVVADDGAGTLLDLLRHQLGKTDLKDGCSPQGQCGCCTVLVDGQPRVACVTPVKRVAGRAVTTVGGLEADRRDRWAQSFTATGASQCGFCTPGIIVRFDALSRSLSPTEVGGGSVGAGHQGQAGVGGRTGPKGRDPVGQALLAHLCRCTGWQTISEAWDRFHADPPVSFERSPSQCEAAERRARLEGGTAQKVGPEVALGRAGFSADEAPADAMIALSHGAGGWVVGDSTGEARAALGRIQGRRTTAKHSWPLTVPDGAWAATLRTTWVEPAYLETDASWCEPGGEPAPIAANGGAFGAKSTSPVEEAARTLADHHQRPVLALASREDVTRWGPKRPPVAGGARPDGTGVLNVIATPGIAEAVAAVAPGIEVVEFANPGVGPSTSAAIRAAGWAEAQVLLAGARGHLASVTAPNGATASAEIVDNGPSGLVIRATVSCGPVLDEVILRSYCIGAAHMAWSWVTGEALTVGDDGTIHDLTIRSFGVTRAVDTPPIEITIEAGQGEPRNGSDAVFAAVAAATWLAAGWDQDWPVGVPVIGGSVADAGSGR
ncbi:MAG: 2Fe-2S iron-sulfur cluster binding domain-containing protein [Actinomycetia bacterium]|nr:2Fe-2S iron-sulfur cluster binding domain-containing protein [Actinomycetes bacterium]